MKKFIFNSLICLSLGTASLFADWVSIPFNDLTPEIIEDFTEGRNPNLVVEFTKGSEIPFQLNLQGDFLKHVSSKPTHTFEVVKTWYVKNYQGVYLFSTDKENWQDVLSFFTGNAGLSAHKEDDRDLTLELKLELNKR